MTALLKKLYRAEIIMAARIASLCDVWAAKAALRLKEISQCCSAARSHNHRDRG